MVTHEKDQSSWRIYETIMRKGLIFVLFSALSSCVKSRVFYYIPVNMPWTEAQTYCRRHYTDLATVDDQAEYDELAETIPKGLRNELWIGLYRSSATAPWIWSDRSKSTFRLWGISQPNNAGGLQFCVATSLSGNWNDRECLLAFPFLCYRLERGSVMRLTVKSSQSVNDPAVRTDVLLQIEQILKEKGLPEEARLSWKIQPDGNAFQKSRGETTASRPNCEKHRTS